MDLIHLPAGSTHGRLGRSRLKKQEIEVVNGAAEGRHNFDKIIFLDIANIRLNCKSALHIRTFEIIFSAKSIYTRKY